MAIAEKKRKKKTLLLNSCNREIVYVTDRGGFCGFSRFTANGVFAFFVTSRVAADPIGIASSLYVLQSGNEGSEMQTYTSVNISRVSSWLLETKVLLATSRACEEGGFPTDEVSNVVIRFSDFYWMKAHTFRAGPPLQ
ncbi:hypothetical protein BaRGS_00032173 [Batillaria attramentaria]|uniref:Uncharacterized protein n=1 Tax=Batillaria attramentaria TaxID=370345 RepID=A0ABD0JNF2_9CAEN